MKRLAILFTIFLVSVILLADLGFMRIPMRLLNRIPLGDKIMHFLLIGTLTFLVASSLIQSLRSIDPKWVALAVGFVLAVIFTLEELSQDFFRGRETSMKDLLANYAGILFFGVTAWIVNKKRKP
jgi:VanZ family protein